MSSFSPALYNSLPSVAAANRLFTNRDEMLSKLAVLFSKEENKKFGVCLVHRHCILEEGERMVTKGNISQPERVRDAECYPERWLATGEAYEFNREPTIAPRRQLFDEFRKIVGDVKVLGLFYIREDKNSADKMKTVALERTEGRRNIVENIPYHTPRRALTTAWHLGQSTTDVTVKLYECASCEVANNSHIENVEKMEGLERRRDLGHDIGWLTGDSREVRVV